MERRLIEDILTDVYYAQEQQRQAITQRPTDDGTGRIGDGYRSWRAKSVCDTAAVDGRLTWRDALQTEIAAALVETNEDALREALVRAASVTVQWIESLDKRWLDRQRKV